MSKFSSEFYFIKQIYFLHFEVLIFLTEFSECQICMKLMNEKTKMCKTCKKYHQKHYSPFGNSERKVYLSIFTGM